MSDYLTDRITRRMEQLQREIDEAKRKARPHTEKSFESGEHLSNGVVIQPYMAPKPTRAGLQDAIEGMVRHGVLERDERAHASIKRFDPPCYDGSVFGPANYGTPLDGLSPIASSYMQQLDAESKRIDFQMLFGGAK